jgi:hypothetical protein
MNQIDRLSPAYLNYGTQNTLNENFNIVFPWKAILFHITFYSALYQATLSTKVYSFWFYPFKMLMIPMQRRALAPPPCPSSLCHPLYDARGSSSSSSDPMRVAVLVLHNVRGLAATSSTEFLWNQWPYSLKICQKRYNIIIYPHGYLTN